MQQPSLHSRAFRILITRRGLSAVFLWWAVINTSIPLPEGGGAYSSIHGPFQTAEKCLAFARLFRSTYDDRASGAQVAGIFCVDPRKGKVVK